MSTYLDLQTRVSSDFLNRTTVGSEVKRAILAAIRYYERRRWRFNETATSIATVASQTFVTLPTNFLFEDKLKLTSNGSTNDLNKRSLDFITDMRDNSTPGQPTDYTIYANKIQLALTPDAIYACPLYYVKSLTELSADADTNAWTQGAMQDLIVHAATKEMWASVVRNGKEAAIADARERAALAVVASEFEQFEFFQLMPTRF